MASGRPSAGDQPGWEAQGKALTPRGGRDEWQDRTITSVSAVRRQQGLIVVELLVGAWPWSAVSSSCGTT